MVESIIVSACRTRHELGFIGEIIEEYDVVDGLEVGVIIVSDHVVDGISRGGTGTIEAAGFGKTERPEDALTGVVTRGAAYAGAKDTCGFIQVFVAVQNARHTRRWMRSHAYLGGPGEIDPGKPGDHGRSGLAGEPHLRYAVAR